MSRESLLHVSVIIYSHLLATPEYAKRYIHCYHTGLSVVNGKIHNANIPYATIGWLIL
jgi:hypothetical protein